MKGSREALVQRELEALEHSHGDTEATSAIHWTSLESEAVLSWRKTSVRLHRSLEIRNLVWSKAWNRNRHRTPTNNSPFIDTVSNDYPDENCNDARNPHDGGMSGYHSSYEMGNVHARSGKENHFGRTLIPPRGDTLNYPDEYAHSGRYDPVRRAAAYQQYLAMLARLQLMPAAASRSEAWRQTALGHHLAARLGPARRVREQELVEDDDRKLRLSLPMPFRCPRARYRRRCRF
jgi:hypothetical protein